MNSLRRVGGEGAGDTMSYYRRPKWGRAGRAVYIVERP
jgi:hypothetical protein